MIKLSNEEAVYQITYFIDDLHRPNVEGTKMKNASNQGGLLVTYKDGKFFACPTDEEGEALFRLDKLVLQEVDDGHLSPSQISVKNTGRDEIKAKKKEFKLMGLTVDPYFGLPIDEFCGPEWQTKVLHMVSKTSENTVIVDTARYIMREPFHEYIGFPTSFLGKFKYVDRKYDGEINAAEAKYAGKVPGYVIEPGYVKAATGQIK